MFCYCHYTSYMQFGIDQLIDATTTECKSFIIWLCWFYYISPVVVEYIISCVVLSCVDHNTYLMLLMTFNVTVALALKSIFSHVLIKEPITYNPDLQLSNMLSSTSTQDREVPLHTVKTLFLLELILT